MSDGPESIAILLGRLRDSVEHLAWPPSRQKEYLVEPGVAPLADELALEFDDAIRPLSPFLDEVALSVSTRQALRELDAVLARMS